MRRILALALFLAAPIPQDASPIGGVWTLNKSASELPRDIGFNPSWVAGAGAGDGSTAKGGGGGSTRGRGGRGGGGGGSTGSAPPFAPRAESYDDARRLTLLNTDARNPPARLTIVDTPAAVTMTNELGQSRTLHPDGKAETIEIEGVPVTVTSKRETDRLIVT